MTQDEIQDHIDAFAFATTCEDSEQIGHSTFDRMERVRRRYANASHLRHDKVVNDNAARWIEVSKKRRLAVDGLLNDSAMQALRKLSIRH